MDDTEVLKKIQSGDSESYAILVEKYHRPLLNFIYRLTGDSQTVEDIGQEIFFSVYRSIRSFNISRGVPFSAWLFIAAKNRCLSELRKNRPPAVSIDALANLPSSSQSPEQTARGKERLWAIQAALEQIPEPYRQTILQNIRGDSPEEIAKNSGIPRGTVKSRLSRARERMRHLLQEPWGGSHHE